MNVWRLISYHEPERRDEVLDYYFDKKVIAIGWGDVGDLDKQNFRTSGSIGEKIRDKYPELNNSQFGGPSLWNFWYEVKIGDLIIVKSYTRRLVVEVTGEYQYNDKGLTDIGINDYFHQRKIKIRSDKKANIFHKELGGKQDKGQSPRWAMFKYPQLNIL